MARMKIVRNTQMLGLDTAKKIYTCSQCGMLFNWHGEASWYGSIKDMENNPKKLLFSCSDRCKDLLQQNKLNLKAK